MKWLPLLWFGLSLHVCAQTVPFELHDGFLITSRCAIGDLRNLIAVVDTGVTETTLDLRIAKRLSLPMRTENATVGTRNAAIQAISIPRIDFGPVHSENLSGIAADLSSLTHQMGIRPDVLIGMDVLMLSNFILDYKAKTITFGSAPPLKHSAKLISVMRLALLDATIDGKRLRFQVDTGFNSILVYGGKLGASPLQEPGAHASTSGIPLRAQRAYVRELQIGDWKFNRVDVYVTDEGPAGNPGFDGLLGPTAVGIRRLAFNFEMHTVAWE